MAVAVGVGARDDEGRHVHHVGGEARRDQRADELPGRDEHLPAHVAALLLGGELVLEVHACGTSLDHRLHQLEGVEGPAEAGLRVRHDRYQPIALALAFGVLDLVCAQQRLVDAPHHVRHAVDRIEALIGIHLAGGVRVRGDLPAREVDGPETGADLLDRHVAGQRAEGGEVALRVQQIPKALRSQPRQRMLDPERAPQPLDVGPRVGTHDPGEAGSVGAGLFACGAVQHGHSFVGHGRDLPFDSPIRGTTRRRHHSCDNEEATAEVQAERTIGLAQRVAKSQ